MATSTAALFHICIGLQLQKKEYKGNRGKNEEESHQIWIDFKPIFKLL